MPKGTGPIRVDARRCALTTATETRAPRIKSMMNTVVFAVLLECGSTPQHPLFASAARLNVKYSE